MISNQGIGSCIYDRKPEIVIFYDRKKAPAQLNIAV